MTDLPQPPVTFWRDGRPALLRIVPPYLCGAAVAWVFHGLLGWMEFFAMLAGLLAGLPFVVRWRHSAALVHHTKRLQTRPELLLFVQMVGNGLGAMAIVSVPLHGTAWSGMTFILAPFLIAGGIPLAISGRPRRVGTQRVCKFCDYEYTYGYPPETDLSAPPRCPECGKGWLADLALGVKQTRPLRIACGAACILLGLSAFLSPLLGARLLPRLPTGVVEAMTFDRGRVRSDAWDELSQRMANFTAADHERIFTKLLDRRRESLFLISRSQHSYFCNNWGRCPPICRSGFIARRLW